MKVKINKNKNFHQIIAIYFNISLILIDDKGLIKNRFWTIHSF